MNQVLSRILCALTLLLMMACTDVPAPEAPAPESPVETQPSSSIAPFTTMTADSVTIYGEPYFENLDASAPLILLFHQGGSNGRGEYADLARWLNEEGFRAIAWDQRSGGDTYGEANRTAAGMAEGTPAGYCDAYPDLQAAHDFVMAEALAEKVVVWGSSYSAALVFRLAQEHPETVSGVFAFSPASGGPLADCRARMWIDEVAAPVFIFRPASEMEREPSIEQRDVLTAGGATFHVIEDGIHGSSMLVDARTEHDMSDTRQLVLNHLCAVTQLSE